VRRYGAMSQMVVTPRVRRLICANAHPTGCALNIRRLVEKIGKAGPGKGLGNVLVIGSSTGYGVASLVTAAWGWGANALGVCYERPALPRRTASAGWYNTAEILRLAREQGRQVEVLNGDAFAHEMRRTVADIIADRYQPLDLVIYSVASPRRKDPDSDTVWTSVLKPIDTPHAGKHIDLRTETITGHDSEPATEAEIASTVKVMGGEDGELWIRLLAAEGLLAEGARTVAYSYIGPRVTHPIYRTGTIGRAKMHLEATADRLDSLLVDLVDGHAWVAVNKAAVTQSSAVIPAVPLYKSLLYRVMKEAGTHELPSDQIIRLFEDHLGAGRAPGLDGKRRIRLDDREMAPEIQHRVSELWKIVSTENLDEISDWSGFKREFLQLFGFGVDGVNYDEPVEIDVPWS
jgi:enoyl-[acyl-carrier protein] reductase/trans-2-enoyl-CoA reductase (NAD+)